MKFKKFLLHFIIVCVACTNFFNNIYAENNTSDSAVEYNYDDDEDDYDYNDYNDYNYDDDDDEDSQSEETTETTTAAVETGNITAPGGAPSFTVSAEGCVVMDANTGMVLYGKNADEKLYPASITKVMTGLLAVEYGHLQDTITVSHNAVNSIPWDSSKMDLVEGEQLSFENVIYGLMLKSGNDSAMVIAETVAGSEDAFVEMMNERAAALGAVNTHFVNPHGYHDVSHYTTAYDMALITKEAVKNSDFNTIWGTEEREVLATNKSERRLMYHTDKMLHQEYTDYYYENLVGGKTGYHSEAMNTLVSYGKMGDVDLICVVMKEPSYEMSYTDTKNLLNYGFSLYKNTKVFSADDYTGSVPVVQYYKDKTIELGNVSVGAVSDFSAVLPTFIEESQITTTAQLAESIEAPVAKGDVIGTLTLNFGEYTIGTLDITAKETISAIPQSELIKEEKMEAFRNNIIRVLSVIGGAIVTVLLFVLLLKIWFAGRKPKRRKKSKTANNRRSNSNVRNNSRNRSTETVRREKTNDTRRERTGDSRRTTTSENNSRSASNTRKRNTQPSADTRKKTSNKSKKAVKKKKAMPKIKIKF